MFDRLVRRHSSVLINFYVSLHKIQLPNAGCIQCLEIIIYELARQTDSE